jgi:hypothetical protein
MDTANATPEARVNFQSSASDDDADSIGSNRNDDFDHQEMEMAKSSASGREDDAEFLEHQTFMQKFLNVAFSVLFFMAHGNKSPELIEYVSMITEDLQLFAFFITYEIGDLYLLPSGLSRIVQIDFGAMSLSDYKLVMCFTAGAVFLMILNIGIVAQGFIVCTTRNGCVYLVLESRVNTHNLSLLIIARTSKIYLAHQNIAIHGHNFTHRVLVSFLTESDPPIINL